ncbi:ArsR/SmtB family transcription factor [Pseudonocardia cypriaca]|uniref:DNA-binding transcriptional ArsR family regulator n=1 Tax=Pseudonocardia cypriaca TaxID=882449 RepID=A0A543FN92_9PSEU|nr:metalloregulator ArsR/SmtB family transcription factor [Pseudonocardia cypriaca]TQM35338.1 DNA-binding transcriptional ArsR family regulator [Pseudonocardia cypriaca]
MDEVFKALADPTRRSLLDRLREQNGQTLRELCERLDMARQSATQHLDVLAQANLVTVVRRGRERLHYLNPVPIHEIEERWISGFDKARMRLISEIKIQAEEYAMTEETVPGYVYVTYIRASAEQVWQALTDADVTTRYWGHANVSDWQPGSTWEHRRVDGSGQLDAIGKVVDTEPPTRLVITFEDSLDESRDPSVVTFLVEPHQDIVRLTVTHENLPNREMLNGISSGWPAVLANLKSLLETGDVLPQAPWDMAPAHV